MKLNNNRQAIQYATEALQYNKIDSNALLWRARAFEKEKWYVLRNITKKFLQSFSYSSFLFSYADYARVPASSFIYHEAQRACEK